MNKNVLIVLIGGFIVAVLVAVIVQSTLSGASKEETAIQQKIEILVAAKDLKTGTEIESGDLKWQIWPDNNVFIGAIIRDGEQTPVDAANGKLLRPLVEGQPVHMTLLVEEDSGDFLSANVQKGMRAVGLSVKSHVLADRLIRPGDFVDVMVTYRVRVNTRDNPEAQSLVNRYATETVIENVRILAIDKEDTKAIDEDADSKKPKVKSSKNATLTLEVSPQDAEKMMLVTELGDIGIALRSIGDNSTAAGDGMTTDVGMSRVMTTLSNMQETSSGVRIYNGTQMQEVRARNGQSQSNVNFDLETPFNSEGEDIPSATVTFSPAAIQQIIREDLEE